MRICAARLRCRLVVAEGGEDVTIKVSDEGGGIPRSGLARIWTYLYSTAKSRVQVEELQVCALCARFVLSHC
jgi:signal transduction histidine kinase